jgi:chromosome segregation ATPase
MEKQRTVMAADLARLQELHERTTQRVVALQREQEQWRAQLQETQSENQRWQERYTAVQKLVAAAHEQLLQIVTRAETTQQRVGALRTSMQQIEQSLAAPRP